MLRTRVIPVLLLRNAGLVKTVRFKNEKYIGDPINAIKIFNDKEVDELMIMDIDASRRGSINWELISRINKEAFMPLGYGGGIRSLDDIQRVLGLGYEKIVLNSKVLQDPGFISRAAAQCGSQSVLVCIDVKKDWRGRYFVYNYLEGRLEKMDPFKWCVQAEELGAGEIILHNVDLEGTFSGYDLDLIHKMRSRLNVPLVALGGARNLEDFRAAVHEAGADAVAAGSMFVFHGKHRAVLITYPDKKEMRMILDR